MNKEKALSKKLLGCARDHVKVEMKQNKNLVLEFSTSAYELVKQSIYDFLHLINSDSQLQLAFDEEKVLDDNGDNIEMRFKVVNRKADGNPGRISKLTINCYHTTSRILVNGSKVDLFVNDGLPLVKQRISQCCSDLDDLNKHFEKAIESLNSVKSHQSVGITNNCRSIQAQSPEIINIELDTDILSEKSSYFCPNCEEVAGQQTICCESCDAWYHYDCVGVTVNDVSKISSEVPFICENCNEGIIYGENNLSQPNVVSDSQASESNTQQASYIVDSECKDGCTRGAGSDAHSVSSARPQSNVINNTSSLNVELLSDCVRDKANKKNGDCKINTTKSKRNHVHEYQQNNLHQSQYIQRLESKIRELQSSVSVLKDRDQLLSNGSVPCERIAQPEMPGQHIHSSDRDNSIEDTKFQVQNMDMRIKQLEASMFQNLYLMTLGSSQTNFQFQQQANLLQSLQLQQLGFINSFLPRAFVPPGVLGNTYHPPFGMNLPHGMPYGTPQSMYQPSMFFNSSIPPPNMGHIHVPPVPHPAPHNGNTFFRMDNVPPTLSVPVVSASVQSQASTGSHGSQGQVLPETSRSGFRNQPVSQSKVNEQTHDKTSRSDCSYKTLSSDVNINETVTLSHLHNKPTTVYCNSEIPQNDNTSKPVPPQSRLQSIWTNLQNKLSQTKSNTRNETVRHSSRELLSDSKSSNRDDRKIETVCNEPITESFLRVPSLQKEPPDPLREETVLFQSERL